MDPIEIHNKLLDRHSSGKLTLEDLHRDCVYWSLMPDCWAEITKLEPWPLMPREVEDYLHLEVSKRAQIGEEVYSQHKNYFEARRKTFVENYSRYRWLQEMKRWLPAEDLLNHGRIQEKLDLFKEQLKVWWPGYEAFDKFVDLSAEAKKAVEVFSGSPVRVKELI